MMLHQIFSSIKKGPLPIRVFCGEFSQPGEILRDFEVANLIQILAHFAIVLHKLACADLVLFICAVN
jgi:hypothetical protein